MGFESTIPVFKQAKTVHALDGAASVIGLLMSMQKTFLGLMGQNSKEKGMEIIVSEL
jgi:hypothetical protein